MVLFEQNGTRGRNIPGGLPLTGWVRRVIMSAMSDMSETHLAQLWHDAGGTPAAGHHGTLTRISTFDDHH